MPNIPDDLETIADAAAKVGLHRTTVHRYVRHKWLRKYKIQPPGRGSKVSLSELRALIANPPVQLDE